MKKYIIQAAIVEYDTETGLHYETPHIHDIGPKFTFLDQALTIYNGLINTIAVIEEELKRDQL